MGDSGEGAKVVRVKGLGRDIAGVSPEVLVAGANQHDLLAAAQDEQAFDRRS